MTLTDIQKTRVKIQDPPIVENLTRYGDGTANVFIMPHINLTTASAYVPLNATAWSATACTFDNSGVATFTNIISANSAFNVRYVHTTFSEDEIQTFLDEGGSILGAALAACEALMFDSLKRSRWMASDGTSYDDTSSQAAVRQLHDVLLEQIKNEAMSGGGFGSWALNQDGNF